MQSKCVVRNSFFKCLLLTVKYGREIYSELLRQLLRKLGTTIKVYIFFSFQVVYELPTSNQWSFDVQWCPRNPGVISSCSFDGHISVYSLMGGGHPPTTPTDKVVMLLMFVNGI